MTKREKRISLIPNPRYYQVYALDVLLHIELMACKSLKLLVSLKLLRRMDKEIYKNEFVKAKNSNSPQEKQNRIIDYIIFYSYPDNPFLREAISLLDENSCDVLRTRWGIDDKEELTASLVIIACEFERCFTSKQYENFFIKYNNENIKSDYVLRCVKEAKCKIAVKTQISFFKRMIFASLCWAIAGFLLYYCFSTDINMNDMGILALSGPVAMLSGIALVILGFIFIFSPDSVVNYFK